MEQWRSLQDYPTYSVSSHGRIRSDRFDRVLRNVVLPTGHVFVQLRRDNTKVNRSVARLVIQSFVSSPDPEIFDTPIHLDGNHGNCHVANLLWRPRWFAKKYSRQFRIDHPQNRAVRNRKTGEVHDRIWDLVTRDGVLYIDVIMSAWEDNPVWPTRQSYEWVD